jgi:hypothetical protein
MSSRDFWHCTPRKLSALCIVHADLNNPKKKQKTPLTVDGVPVKQKVPNAKGKGGGVGTPNAFIDQI